MSYHSINDALQDLTAEQVTIDLDPDGERHKITLHVCSEGLAIIFSELSETLPVPDDGGNVLMQVCPALKNINAADLLCSLISGDDPEDILQELLENVDELPDSNASKSTILDDPKVGDMITSTREVTGVDGYYGSKTVNYKDENGKQSSVLASSWKGFGKSHKVSRK